MAEATGQLPILVGILVNLTEAHAALGGLAAAGAASNDALDLARNLDLVPLQLQALEARAELEAHRGNYAAAAALVQVVLADPAVRSYTSGSAGSLWERLTPTLTPAEVAAASTFGRDVTVAEALECARYGGTPIKVGVDSRWVVSATPGGTLTDLPRAPGSTQQVRTALAGITSAYETLLSFFSVAREDQRPIRKGVIEAPRGPLGRPSASHGPAPSTSSMRAPRAMPRARWSARPSRADGRTSPP